MPFADQGSVQLMHKRVSEFRASVNLPPMKLNESCCHLAHDVVVNAARLGKIYRNHCQVVAHVPDPDAAVLTFFDICLGQSENRDWFYSNEEYGMAVAWSELGTFWAATFGLADVHGPTPAPVPRWSSWWGLLFGR